MSGLRRFWWATGTLLVSGLIALSLLPLPQLPGATIPYGDKVGHFVAYGFTALWLAQLTRRRSMVALILAGLLGLGGVLELVQATLPERSGEWPDLLADALGLGVGGALWRTPAGRLLIAMESRRKRAGP